MCFCSLKLKLLKLKVNKMEVTDSWLLCHRTICTLACSLTSGSNGELRRWRLKGGWSARVHTWLFIFTLLALISCMWGKNKNRLHRKLTSMFIVQANASSYSFSYVMLMLFLFALDWFKCSFVFVIFYICFTHTHVWNKAFIHSRQDYRGGVWGVGENHSRELQRTSEQKGGGGT